MQRIQYRDFKITFLSKRGKTYALSADSPAGKVRGELRLDLSGLQDTWVEVGQSVRRVSAPAADIPLTPVEQVGEKLYSALFSGKVNELWERNLGQLLERTQAENSGLRIKLEMDPDAPAMAQLMSLPWEFIYKKEERKFLSLDPSTPIVRYLSVPQPLLPYAFKPPLRILVVISGSSADKSRYAALDLATERARIESAWANLSDVQVDFLPRATLTALRPQLQQHDYHVLHFMGHGDFDRETGQGVLLFEDEYGDVYPINGRDLADQLIGKKSLRLVFLNACETARMSDAPGQDPFAGTAAALVMCGIPAVIAMQYPISDRAAIAFAEAFYRNLARNIPVDQATAEGRLAVRGKFRLQMEWGTPVLFMRTDDGQLFDIEAAPRAEPLDIPAVLADAIHDCFRGAGPIILAALPTTAQPEGTRWLEQAREAVLRLPRAGSLATLRSALYYFRSWPAAHALVQELLQEPLLQHRARLCGETVARDYERLIFESPQ